MILGWVNWFGWGSGVMQDCRETTIYVSNSDQIKPSFWSFDSFTSHSSGNNYCDQEGMIKLLVSHIEMLE